MNKNIIEIEEDFQVPGTVIMLEKGDRIEVLKEISSEEAMISKGTERALKLGFSGATIGRAIVAGINNYCSVNGYDKKDSIVSAMIAALSSR